jgi:hypothetical protein
MELATLLLVVVLAQDAAPPPSAPGRATREFTVRLPLAHGSLPLELDLFPERGDGRNVLADEPDEEVNAGGIAAALKRVLARGDDDSVLVSWNEHTIEVTADEATLAEVPALLAGVEAASFGDEQLDVRALRISAADESFDGPTRMPEAEADRRERALLAAKHGRLLRRATTALADGSTARAGSLSSHRYVADFDVEIADGSAIYAPVTTTDEIGLEVRARAARLADATWLDLAVRELERLDDPPRVRALEPKVWFASPTPHEDDLPTAQPSDLTAAMFHERVPLKVETPARGGIGLAGSFVVPDGQVLWLPCRATTKRGPVALVLEVRTRGPFRPSVQRFAGASVPTRDARVVHLGALQSRGFAEPSFDFPSFLPRPTPGGNDEPRAGHAWPSLAELAAPEVDPSGALGELKRRVEASHEIAAARFTPSELLVAAPMERSAELDALLAPLLRSPDAFAIGGRVVADGTKVVDFKMEAISGRPLTIWTGAADAFLADWDIDIADCSQIGNPSLLPLFDGAALAVTVRPLTDGSLQVSVHGVLNFLDGTPAETPLPSPYAPAYDRLRARRVVLDDLQVVDAAQPATTLRFGDRGLGLEVDVAALSPSKPLPRSSATATASTGAVTRSYDVARLVAPRGRSLDFDLCPRRSTEHDLIAAAREFDEGHVVEAALEVDALEGFLVDALRPAPSAAGEPQEPFEKTLAIDARADELVITTTPELHARVAALLAAGERALPGRERCEVRILAGHPAVDGASIVDVADADRATSEGGAQGPLRVLRAGAVALVDDRAGDLLAEDDATYVGGSSGNVWHGADVEKPEIFLRAAGLAARVAGARRHGTTRLDVALRWMEDVAPVRTLVVAPHTKMSTPVPPGDSPLKKFLASDGGTEIPEQIELPLELPAARCVGVAGTFDVPDGKVLWLPCRVATSSGPLDVVVELRVRGPARDPVQLVADPGARVERALVDIGTLARAGFAHQPFDEKAFRFEGRDDGETVDEYNRHAWPSVVHGLESGSDFVEELRSAAAKIPGGGDVRIVPLTTTRVLIDAPAAVRDALFRDHEERQRTLVARIVRGGVEVAHLKAPATVGRWQTIVAGAAVPYLARWEMEPGEYGSFAGGTTIGELLDGIALAFRVVEGEGGARVEVDGVASLLDGPIATKALDNPRTPLVEVPPLLRRQFQAMRPIVSGTPTRIALAVDDLSLEIELEER